MIKGSKIMKKLFITVLSLLLISGCATLLGIQDSPGVYEDPHHYFDKGDFVDLYWGMSFYEVADKYPDATWDDINHRVLREGNKGDLITALKFCEFNEIGELSGGKHQLEMRYRYDTDKAIAQLYNEYRFLANEQYGEPFYDKRTWENDSDKAGRIRDLSYIMNALKEGGRMITKWENNRTLITLNFYYNRKDSRYYMVEYYESKELKNIPDHYLGEEEKE